MGRLVKAGAVVPLMVACFGTSAVQAGAAEKRVRTDASPWTNNWTVATVPITGSLPGDWAVRPASRAPASPWTPNDGVRVLNANPGRLIPGTINSSWNNASGGNWSASTDWTPNGSPNNGGNVYDVTQSLPGLARAEVIVPHLASWTRPCSARKTA